MKKTIYKIMKIPPNKFSFLMGCTKKWYKRDITIRNKKEAFKIVKSFSYSLFCLYR